MKDIPHNSSGHFDVENEKEINRLFFVLNNDGYTSKLNIDFVIAIFIFELICGNLSSEK